MMNRDVEVEITYLPTDHGGRASPAFNGYRPQFYYAGRDWDAQHEYPDVERVAPGQTARAFLTFMSPASHLGKVVAGMPFLIREGNRVVGYGSVVRVVDLDKSAARDDRSRGD